MINIDPTTALLLPIDELAMMVLEDITHERENITEFNYLYHYSDNQNSPYRNQPGRSPDALYAIAEAIA